MASTKLFPPVISAYTNAFKKNETLKIFFSPSSLNTMEEVVEIHVMINRQDTNRSALSKTLYPNGIKRINNHSTLSWVEINPEDIENGWEERSLYKIQVRFSDKLFDGLTGENTWLNNNTSHFSEWSTVSLTKCIGNVFLAVPSLGDDSGTATSEDLVLYLSSIVFEGQYNNENDKSEFLSHITLDLKDEEDELLETSGEIFLQSNNIKYEFKERVVSNKKYKITYRAETCNHYILSKEYIFTTQDITSDLVNCEIYCEEADREEDEEEGSLTVHVKSALKNIFSGNIDIQRTSSLSNFTSWEDVCHRVIRNEVIDFSFKDFTVESGVFYKYAIRSVELNIVDEQKIELNGGFEYMGAPHERQFNYAYLLGKNNKQLKLCLNHQITDFTSKVSDSVQETLGGKYPVFSRNGNLRYKTFQINGLISFEQDENKNFILDNELFGNNELLDLHEKQIFNDGRLREYDFTKERFFREKVLDFLQDFSPKVYKSPSEGNLIVQITDLSFSPKGELSNLIYEFSATLTECEEYSYDNLIKEKIISLTDYSSDFSTITTRLGQINGNVKMNTDIVSSLINKKYQFENKSILGNVYDVKNIRAMRIRFNSKPTLMIDQRGEKFLGYKIKLNDKIICIDKTGFFVVDRRMNINNLEILPDYTEKNKAIDVTIDFIYDRVQSLKKGKPIKSRSNKINVGQIFGCYTCGQEFYNILYSKHSFEWTKAYQRLKQLKRITVEGNPNTVLLIQDSKDIKPEKHVIGETGILNLSSYEDNNISISNVGVYGTWYGNYSDFLPEEKITENTVYQNNHLYNKGLEKFLFKDGKFIPIIISEDRIYDITTKVDLIIDYIYSVEKGTYY